MALTAEQIEGARQELRDTLITVLPEHKARWEDIFSPDHPLKMAPSHDVCGQVAYSAKPEIAADDHDHRTRTTLQRFVSRQCGIEVTAAVNQALVKAIGAAGKWYPIREEFSLLLGKAITEAYANAIGASSCMVGPGYSRQIRFYEVNSPARVRLLCWRKELGKYSARARALLWTMDDGKLYLDRIYAGDANGALIAYEQYCAVEGIEVYYGHAGGNNPPHHARVTIDDQNDRILPSMDSWRMDADGNLWRGGLNCANCRKRRLPTEVIAADGYNWCYACADKLLSTCRHCEVRTRNGCLIDGEHVCTQCRTARYFKCHECAVYVPQLDQPGALATGNRYCANCVNVIAARITAGAAV